VSAGLDISLETRPIERLEGELLVAGFFSDDRPLRGGVARVDWRLCGLISQLIQQDRLRGARGEALLMPATGPIAAQRILLIGLGQRHRFRMVAAQEMMRDAVARALRLGVPSLTISPLGIPGDDFPRHAEAVLEGALAALRADPARLRIRIAIRGEEIDRANAALETAARQAGPGEVRLAGSARSAAPRLPPQGASRVVS